MEIEMLNSRIELLKIELLILRIELLSLRKLANERAIIWPHAMRQQGIFRRYPWMSKEAFSPFSRPATWHDSRRFNSRECREVAIAADKLLSPIWVPEFWLAASSYSRECSEGAIVP